MRHALALGLAVALAGCDGGDVLGLYPSIKAEAEAPLALTGRVVDAAEIIPADMESHLTNQLAALERDTSAQFVVVTTPDLSGYYIEDYSLQLGRAWGIGDAERDDGVLLVVAPNERKVRIEVGYGLEDTVLPDEVAAQYIRAMIPHFERSDMTGAITVGVDSIDAHLRAQTGHGA
ncbi:MAG: TPM domain-containing protein [Parerythrobacter sp.]